MNDIKLTKDTYQELFKKKWGKKYEIVENQKYITSETVMKIRCKKCGTIFPNSMKNLIHGKKNKLEKCPNCRTLKFNESLEEKMIEMFGRNPYKFLSEYKDVHTKMKVKCKDCNSEFEVNFNNIKNTYRTNGGKYHYCKTCSFKRIQKLKSNSEEQAFQSIKDRNNGESPYEFLSPYKGSNEYITVKCKVCGDVFEAKFHNLTTALFRGKYYCPKCHGMKRYDKSYSEIIKELSPNIIFLESCDNKKRLDHIKCKCSICNYEWNPLICSLLIGENCPNCNHRIGKSINEDEIAEFLEKNNISFERRKRGIIGRYELDFFIPDYRIAIECDGLHWHSTRYKDKNYHLMKTNLCKEKGIRLIHIFENEWRFNKDICKDRLRVIFGITKKYTKVYGRYCWIEEISKNDKKDFLEKNHIQGNDKSSINLGLYCMIKKKDKISETLVAVMTFCKPRNALGQKKNSNYDYELSRYSVKQKYLVIGGFSKLLKYFERNYDWKKIITYADKRWSTGNLYLKCGFTYIRDSKPNYWYYYRNKHQLYHRYNFRKSELKKKFPDVYDDSLTEKEIMSKIKEYSVIYDCGNMVFEYIK